MSTTTKSEREATFKGKRVKFDIPPKTTGCRCHRHDGFKGEGLVIDDIFDYDDIYVEMDTGRRRYFKFTDLTVID